jgi:hypothetical protein
VRTLHEYSPYLRGTPPALPFDWSVATVRAGLNFPLTTDIGDIDIFGDIAGGGTYDDLPSSASHAASGEASTGSRRTTGRCR